MASESSLRKRQSLVWETREAFKYQKDSPVFELMNSNWILQVIPIYETGKFVSSCYSINLKNCGEVQSIQPFEIVTLLEDRRNGVQMYCSKLTVSSTCINLFKESLLSTYEKLPGLKLYDDVAIVCTFYPSTGLALSKEMVRGSSLRIRHSLVWKTRKPTTYQDRTSSVFNLQNSKWKLELHLANSARCDTSIYQICLRNSNGIQPLEPFEIDTFLVDRENNVQIRCSRLVISSTCETLYKASIHTINELIPGIKNYEDIIIICMFGSPIGSALNDKMENDISFTLECMQCQKQDALSQPDDIGLSLPNQSQSIKYFSDIDNLSEDFGFLLEDGFMSDIELKVGEDVISAHKAVLAARCTTLSAMLQKHIENTNGTFEIKDTEPSVMRELLRYLYSGKISVDISEDMICKLYIASNKYDVKILRNICFCYMIRNLSTENFIKFLILANVHDDHELADSLASFIAKRPEILVGDMWIKFSRDFPKMANEIYQTHILKTIKNRVCERL